MLTERKPSFFRRIATKTGEKIWHNKGRLFLVALGIWGYTQLSNKGPGLLDNLTQPLKPTITTPEISSTNIVTTTVNISPADQSIRDSMLRFAHNNQKPNEFLPGYIDILRRNHTHIYLVYENGRVAEILIGEDVWRAYRTEGVKEILVVNKVSKTGSKE